MSGLPLCAAEYSSSEATASDEHAWKRRHSWEIGMQNIGTSKPDDGADHRACGDPWGADEKIKHGSVLLNV